MRQLTITPGYLKTRASSPARPGFTLADNNDAPRRGVD